MENSSALSIEID